MNPKVDLYLEQGCGRCPLGGTPKCKVHPYEAELAELRMILLDSGLTEDLKWGVPCYTFKNGNVILLNAFNDYVALNFIKGALMKDPHNLLVQQTENVQATRQIRFTQIEKIIELQPVLKTYIQEALEIEKSGKKVELKKTDEFAIPEELQQQLDEHSDFKAAFEALTPGRQRGYLLYFSAPKQSKTRVARIEKSKPRIFDGKGVHDR